MPEEEDDEQDVLVITDDEGTEHHFVSLGLVEVEGREYAVLAPEEAVDGEPAEIYILRHEAEGEGSGHLTDIDDEEELAKVAQIVAEMIDAEAVTFYGQLG